LQDEQLVWIDPPATHAIALHAFAYGRRMALEDVGPERHGFVTALWNVHPDQYIVA
jgi:hypothetical protein